MPGIFVHRRWPSLHLARSLLSPDDGYCYGSGDAVGPEQVDYCSDGRQMGSNNSSLRFSDSTNPGNNLFVTKLSKQTSENDLRDLFAKYGTVASCHVVCDPHTKDSRGFAFVTMDTPEQADQAQTELNNYQLDGRTILVEKAKRQRPRSPTPGQYRGRADPRRRGKSTRIYFMAFG